MDKQSKAPGVYRVILCVLTLALAPVFYAIWQPYNTCLLQLPAAGGAWQLLTRLLYYVLFSLLLAGICRSSLGSKTVAPFGAKPWLRTVGGVLAASLVLFCCRLTWCGRLGSWPFYCLPFGGRPGAPG